MARYKCKYRIGLNDVGMSIRMTNKTVLKVLENAGGMHSESIGSGLNNMKNTNLSWILLGWKVKIINRPKYNEEITIDTWSRNSNKIASYRDYEIYGEDGTLCIIATSKWALVDIRDRKLAQITPEVIEKYQPEEISVFEEKNLEKLKEPSTRKSEIRYRTLRRDIDVNDHVHNLYYLDFAYEALPEEVYRDAECNNIEIMYKKQIKLGDEIVCLYTKQDDENIVTIKSADEESLHAIIKLY